MSYLIYNKCPYTLIKPGHALLPCFPESFLIFSNRDRAAQLRKTMSIITRPILGHNVHIRVRRYFVMDEPHYLPGVCGPLRHNKVPHQKAALRHAPLVDLQIAHLPMHFLESLLEPGQDNPGASIYFFAGLTSPRI